MMKKIISIFAVTLFIFLTSCGIDNYDAPSSTLSGRIVYNGSPLQLRGTGEAVQLQLYQDGYELHNHIQVLVNQDGFFSASLFDGQYKLITRDNNGPWINTRDTVVVNVKGNTTYDLAVTPYFTITGSNISLSGTNVNANFTINQVVSSAKVEKVYLLLGKTHYVDEINNVYRLDINDKAAGSVSISGDYSSSNDAKLAKYLYGRVGVKTVGVEQAVFSEVFQLK
jgi:hypothetical protein